MCRRMRNSEYIPKNSEFKFSNFKSVQSKKLTLEKYLYLQKLFKLEFRHERDLILIPTTKLFK